MPPSGNSPLHVLVLPKRQEPTKNVQPVDRTKNTPHKSLRAQQICLTHTREHLTEAFFSRVDHTVARERNGIVSRKVKDPSFVDLASGLAWLGFVGLGSRLASFAFNARKCTRTRRTHNFALHVSAFVCAVGRLAPFFLDATLPTVLATRFLRLFATFDTLSPSDAVRLQPCVARHGVRPRWRPSCSQSVLSSLSGRVPDPEPAPSASREAVLRFDASVS